MPKYTINKEKLREKIGDRFTDSLGKMTWLDFMDCLESEELAIDYMSDIPCDHRFSVVEEHCDYSSSSGNLTDRRVTKLACEKCGEIKEL